MRPRESRVAFVSEYSLFAADVHLPFCDRFSDDEVAGFILHMVIWVNGMVKYASIAAYGGFCSQDVASNLGFPQVVQMGWCRYPSPIPSFVSSPLRQRSPKMERPSQNWG